MWHIRNGSDHFSERAVAELVDKQRKNQGDRHTPAQAGDIEPNGVANQPPKKPVIKESLKVFKANPWASEKTKLGLVIFKRH